MALTLEQTQKLERIKLYRTRYELVLQHPDGRKYLICYVGGSKSRRTTLDTVREKGEHIARIVGDPDAEIFLPKKSADAATIGQWQVRWGRTQRDAIIEGELTYVGKVAL